MVDRAKRRERMRALLARWRRSGTTGAAFCRREGIPPQKLWYWKRVFGVTSGNGAEPEARPTFVPVRLTGQDEVSATGTGALEIVLGADCRVVVREGVSRELLRDVIAALHDRC